MKPTPAAPGAPAFDKTSTLDEQHPAHVVAAAQAGDEGALRDVIAWAMDYLFPAVLSMLYERRNRGAYITETLHDSGPDLPERLRDDAWAVTHAACCRIAQRIGTFRGRNAFGRKVQFGTWAYAIAQNEMRTLLRDRWRERKRYGGSKDEWENPAPDADLPGRRLLRGVSGIEGRDESATFHLGFTGIQPSPEGAALGRLESALVREALQKAPLTPEQREAVVLFHGYGYRQEQIAAMTGVQVGTVKKRVFDGLRKLRTYVESRQTGAEQDRSPAPPKGQGRGGR